jgi:hypothetical protein
MHAIYYGRFQGTHRWTHGAFFNFFLTFLTLMIFVGHQEQDFYELFSHKFVS